MESTKSVCFLGHPVYVLQEICSCVSFMIRNCLLFQDPAGTAKELTKVIKEAEESYQVC